MTWGMWAMHVGSLRVGEGSAHWKGDVVVLLSPCCCWECAGEGGERASARVRAVQCAEVGTKTSRCVDICMVVGATMGRMRAGMRVCVCLR